jgi:hypothetical protein
MLTTTL